MLTFLQILFLGNLGVTELIIILAILLLVIVMPIWLFMRNQKLKTQNEYLKKDSLNLDLHKLGELKEKGLISELEYQKKKEEILKRL